MTSRIPTFWGKTHAPDEAQPHSKTAYDLRKHMLDTSAAANALWALWLRPGLRELITDAVAPGNEERARRIVATVAGLHDIGKANPIFQTQSRSRRGLPPELADTMTALREHGLSLTTPAGADLDPATTSRHETVSQAILGGIPENGTDRVGHQWAGAVVGGHHGTYLPTHDLECDLAAEALEALTADADWQGARDALVAQVCAANDVELDDLFHALQGDAATAVILITGIVIVADWLASGALSTRPAPELLSTAQKYVTARTTEFRRSLPSTIGLYKTPTRPETAVMGKAGVSLHPLQKAAKEVGRGLWIVAETTGSGKTEAAMLRHMNESESVLWGLPTRATTDAMWGRIQKMFRQGRNIGALLHAHRSLNGFYLAKPTGGSGLQYSEWATEVLGHLKPLLSPVAVGTVDQVLLGALRQKWNPVRLLALANTHVVLDEVHLMDEYQVQLTEDLLRWWGITDTRVTMLSASLPQALTKRFIEAYDTDAALDDVELVYPSHTLARRGSCAAEPLVTARAYELDVTVKEVHLRTGHDPVSTIVEAALSEALRLHTQHPQARIGVVLNRVDSTIQVGDGLLAHGIPDVTVLHSRMTVAHRASVSAELEGLAGKGSLIPGSIVVGTQVIEASLDLDFDILISELAPASALIQRAGRIWRSATPNPDGTWSGHWHGRPTERPSMRVIALTDVDTKAPHEAVALPYSLGSLTRTLHALRERVQAQGSLSIPGDVQPFVDTAHFDLSEAEATIVTDVTEQQKAVIRATSATVRTIRSRDAAGPFEGALTFNKLARLTHGDEHEEASTRFADYEQHTVLIVNEFATSRWLWRGNMVDDRVARLLRTRDPREVSLLLGMTARVSANMVGAGKALIPLIDIATARDRDTSPFRARELMGVIPVRLSGDAVYDERLGMYVPRHRS